VAVVESRFDVGPDSTNLRRLPSRLFLAQGGEAGARKRGPTVGAITGLRHAIDNLQPKITKFNEYQPSQPYITNINSFQQTAPTTDPAHSIPMQQTTGSGT
jgi:hypothetical protein